MNDLDTTNLEAIDLAKYPECKYIGLVFSLARKFFHSRAMGLDLEDYVNIGYLALRLAWNKYQPDPERPFVPYASRSISNAMKRAMSGTHALHIPHNLVIQSWRLEKGYGTSKGFDQRQAHNLVHAIAARQMKRGDCDLLEKRGVVFEPSVVSRECIKYALTCLTDRELEVITMRFGLDGKDPMTLQEIGDLQGGCTRENIRQIESRSLKKMRKFIEKDL